MLFTRAIERAHPYILIQNNVRVSVHELNIKEEVEVNVSSSGIDSLWQFIQDIQRRFSNLDLRYQMLFYGVSISNQVVASLSLMRIQQIGTLREALKLAFEKMSQRSSDSWEEVRGYYGLSRRGALRDADPDIIFARPITIGITAVDAGGCDGKEGTKDVRVNSRITLVTRSHRSQGNNCAFECLRFKNDSMPSIQTLRKQFNLKRKVFIPWNKLEEISNYIECPVRVVKVIESKLLYMDDTYVHLDTIPTTNLVLLRRNHYLSVVDIKTKQNRCKRCHEYFDDKHDECNSSKLWWRRRKQILENGKSLFFDIETAPDIENPYKVGDKIFYPQVAVQACAYITGTGEKLYFWGVDCIARFIDWLDTREVLYYVRAHNGGAFDYYFILAEILKRDYSLEDFSFNNVLLRGSSKILSLEFKGHKFLDTYNHLADSLKNLCNSFKVKVKKITSQVVNGVEWTSEALMMLHDYKMTPQQYILHLEERGLRKAYEEYCMTDCESLAEVWDAYYTASSTLFKKACPSLDFNTFDQKFAATLTIPALAKWGWETKQKEMAKIIWYPKINTPQYKLAHDAVVGGISHVQHFGHHDDTLVCLDVVSLYVWAMMCNEFPYGEPIDTDMYIPGKLGIYMCTYIKCADDPITDVPVYHDGILDWTRRVSYNRPLSNIDIERIRRRGGTVEISNGIYWEENYNYFKDFLEPFTAEKKRQDTLYGTRDYNVSIRNVAKLIGNSLYGKMLERSTKKSFNIVDHPNDLFGLELDFSQCWVHRSNGKYMIQTPDTGENKSPFHLGVFVLSYSRDLMMKYFDMVGRENVIATETDSLYIKKEHMHRLSSVIGTEIGQLTVDIDNISEAYFLSKKGYALRFRNSEGEIQEKFRLKGVVSKALNWDKYVEWHEKGYVKFNDIQVFVRHLCDLETTQIHIGTVSKTVGEVPGKRRKVK